MSAPPPEFALPKWVKWLDREIEIAEREPPRSLRRSGLRTLREIRNFLAARVLRETWTPEEVARFSANLERIARMRADVAQV